MSTQRHNTIKHQPDNRRVLHEIVTVNDSKRGFTKLTEALAPSWINGQAKALGVTVYNRKFDPHGYLLASIMYHGEGRQRDRCRLIHVCRSYNNLVSKEHRLNNKPLHNRMRSEETEQLFKLALAGLLEVQAAAAVAAASSQVLLDTLQEHGVKGLCSVDGSSLAVRPAAAELMHCKVQGRKKLQREPRSSHKNAGSAQGCGIKLHSLWNNVTQSIAGIGITEGVGDEKSMAAELVLKSGVKDCIILADRGYDALSFFDKIRASGNYCLVRLKGNHVFRIVSARDQNGRELPELIGTALRDIPDDKYAVLDLKVQLHPKRPAAGRYMRVVRGAAIEEADDADYDKSKYMLLATTLSSEQVPAGQVIDLYALRWSIECGCFKGCLKGTNSFTYLNSSIPSIIVQHVLAAVMACVIKSILTYEVQKACLEHKPLTVKEAALLLKNQKYLPSEASVEKCQAAFSLTKLLRAIYRQRSRYTIWRIIKKNTAAAVSCANPASSCLRSRSISPRDWKGLKDIRARMLSIAVALFKAGSGTGRLSTA